MSAGRSDAVAVSPTAHYTGQAWVRYGLSDPVLSTRTGRVLHAALRPSMVAARVAGLPTLDDALLARHRAIDAELEHAIADGRVGQVVEVAAGMSPRGLRFARRYGDGLDYVEADLPGMTRRKRVALVRLESLGPHHRVAEVDARLEGGSGSLADLAAGLDPARGAAVVTEGLVNYLRRDDLEALWARIARVLRRFDHGLYVADLWIGEGGPVRSALVDGVSRAVGGRVGLHYRSADEAVAALRAAGFADATVVRGDDHPAAGDAGRRPGAALVHVVVATT